LNHSACFVKLSIRHHPDLGLPCSHISLLSHLHLSAALLFKVDTGILLKAAHYYTRRLHHADHHSRRSLQPDGTGLCSGARLPSREEYWVSMVRSSLPWRHSRLAQPKCWRLQDVSTIQCSNFQLADLARHWLLFLQQCSMQRRRGCQPDEVWN
jgi:hypothetical protein